MLTTALILSLLALSGIDAACTCYTTSTAFGKRIGVSNGYDTSNFAACYPDGGCGFIANSSDPVVGWTSFTATFSSSADSTGKFTIYDGSDDNANNAVITTFSVSESGQTKALTSSTSAIYVKYTQTDSTKPNQYYGSLVANSGLAAPTTTTTTTPAPSTTPYVNSYFARNPQLISHDLLILINQRTDQGNTGLQALNSLATQFVNLLSVTNSITTTFQTRLGLATLTPYAPNYAAQGEIWNMNATDVTGALPQAGVTSSVDIVTALKAVLSAFFNVSDSVAPTRKNVQRSILLFTGWWSDGDLNDDLRKLFADYGVNLAIIGYNTTNDNLINNNWYNYVSLTNTSVTDVASFVNRFYLNSNSNNNLINNWCKKGLDPNSTYPVIMEPSDYIGPQVGATWTSTDGQKGRYCNFQDTTYTYNRENAAKNVSVTVFYELEIENDYLKFFADGVEIESFTGNDVNNANFVVNASVITARLTTDSSGVQRGFSAKFAEI
ncbi:unnamed protein product [Caenorhabditis sp. 36 PRJEB53466]|nr:unnamed protein product [Caenorhabditis sp. 36 PRJEB53466]